MKNKKGFTLVEVLAVVAILAILVLIALPNVLGSFKNAQKRTFLVESKTIYNESKKKFASKYMTSDRLTQINSEDESALDLGSGKSIKYCVDFDGIDGKISKIRVTNGSFFIEGTDDFANNANAADVVVGNFSNFSCDSVVIQENGEFISKIIKPILYNGRVFGSNDIERDDVESITMVGHINVPENALGSWDGSMARDGSIIVWYIDEDNDGKYELYIGSEYTVYFPQNSSNLFANYHNVESITFNNINTTDVTNMGGMFLHNEKLKTLDISSFDTRNVTRMSEMFFLCENLETLTIDPNKFKTNQVFTLNNMFFRCHKLKTVDVSNWDTSNVITMDGVFHECNSIDNLNVSRWNTSNVTSMKDIFRYCERLSSVDVSNWNTSNVTDMSGMFDMMHAIHSLDVSHFDTSKVTNMNSMFRWIENVNTLDLSHFDTSKVTNMGDMFYNDKTLTNVSLASFDTSKVTNMEYMFAYMPQETLDISNFDTRNLTNMHAMFYDMTNLKTIVTGPNFNTSKVTNFSMAFDSCRKLVFDYHKLDTSSATNMMRMMCGSGRSNGVSVLDLSGFDTSNVTDMMGMFVNVSGSELRLDNFDFSKVKYHGGNEYKDSSVNMKMFNGIESSTVIYVKDEVAKNFVRDRLNEAGKSNNIVIAN